MHSATAGTEHRGRVITAMNGLPVTFTPTQEAMNREPSCPDWHDHREHIDGTMPSRPADVHIVYADGKRVHVIPQIKRWNSETMKVDDLGKIAANKVAAIMRRTAAEPVTVTVDAWVNEKHTTNAYDTLPDDRLTQSIYAEAIEAGVTLVQFNEEHDDHDEDDHWSHDGTGWDDPDNDEAEH